MKTHTSRSTVTRPWRTLLKLVSALLLLAVMLAPHPVAAQGPTLVATINGGGTANMDDGMGTTHWGAGIKLFADGTATGSFDCVDQHGDAPGYPGNIWGKVTSWYIDTDGFVSLNVVGKFVAIPGGHPQDVTFTVKIQQFGGAGVGHWTLAVPDGHGGLFTVCFETLTSGQIAIRYAN